MVFYVVFADSITSFNKQREIIAGIELQSPFGLISAKLSAYCVELLIKKQASSRGERHSIHQSLVPFPSNDRQLDEGVREARGSF